MQVLLKISIICIFVYMCNNNKYNFKKIFYLVLINKN